MVQTNYPGTLSSQQAGQVLTTLATEQSATNRPAVALSVGAVVPDFSVKDLDGQALSVAHFKGKVLLLDFWASWCQPCQEELPGIVALYKKFHSQGLEIVGVSQDSDRTALVSFLKQKPELVWSQIIDGENGDEVLASKYNVEGIPNNLLIGVDGRLLGRDLHGAELESALTAALARH